MLGEALSLLIAKAWVLAIGLRVGQIDLLVRAVQVSTCQYWLLLVQHVQVGAVGRIPLEPVGQAGQFSLGIRGIDVDKVKGRELQGDDAPLLIVLRNAQPQRVQLIRHSRKDAGARVALLHRAIPNRLIARQPGKVHLLLLRLGFLETEDVWGAGSQILLQALAHRGSDAVDVPGAESEGAGHKKERGIATQWTG